VQENDPLNPTGARSEWTSGLLALFFALGGTSFAAANALLPRNSVGTSQVINGSLQTSDLSNTPGRRSRAPRDREARRARQAHCGDYHLFTSRTGANSVNVQIFDEKDSPLDQSFYLAVFC
jgi:hypothetical protein